MDTTPSYSALSIDEADVGTTTNSVPTSSGLGLPVTLTIVLIFVLCLLCIIVAYFCYRDSSKPTRSVKTLVPKYNGGFYEPSEDENSDQDETDTDTPQHQQNSSNKQIHVQQIQTAESLALDFDLAKYDRPITISENASKKRFLKILPAKKEEIRVENNPIVEKIRRDSIAASVKDQSGGTSSSNKHQNKNNNTNYNNNTSSSSRYDQPFSSSSSSRIRKPISTAATAATLTNASTRRRSGGPGGGTTSHETVSVAVDLTSSRKYPHLGSSGVSSIGDSEDGKENEEASDEIRSVSTKLSVREKIAKINTTKRF
jgi:hypothetical protein